MFGGGVIVEFNWRSLLPQDFKLPWLLDKEGFRERERGEGCLLSWALHTPPILKSAGQTPQWYER